MHFRRFKRAAAFRVHETAPAHRSPITDHRSPITDHRGPRAAHEKVH
ncbi:conserved hypothetical protein [Burkholderia pseudomallei Pakistan 9]|nr:conserved hypothetical protein [Burkholderia pseudomallei Pakistan 9]